MAVTFQHTAAVMYCLLLCVQQPTFHSDSEGACGGPVAVQGCTLVLSVIFQGDAFEVKHAVVALQSATCFTQRTVLLFPFYLWSGSADTEIRMKRGTGKESRKRTMTESIVEGRAMVGDELIERDMEEIRVE